MYIKEIQSKLFPVGSGSLDVDIKRNLSYASSMAGQSENIELSEELVDYLGKLKAPSHGEMIDSLSPNGNPDMIVLSYWLPDMNFGGGYSLAAELTERYTASEAYSFVLCDSGFRIFPGALDYIQHEIQANGVKEVWFFYLNQFQYGHPDADDLFWETPGLAVWMKLVSDNDNKQYPKISIERREATETDSVEASRKLQWEQQAAAIKLMGSLAQNECVNYNFCEDFDRPFFSVKVNF